MGSSGKAGGGSLARKIVRVHWNANQALNGSFGANLVLKPDTVDEDTDSGWSIANGIYTCASAGLWWWWAEVHNVNGNNNALVLLIYTNIAAAGFALAAYDSWLAGDTGQFGTGSKSVLGKYVALGVGDQVRFNMEIQTNQGVQGTGAGTQISYIEGARVSA